MFAVAVIVVVLAILQYRWTGQISLAEQERIRSTLTAGARQFGSEFSTTLSRLGASLLIDPAAPASQLETSVSEEYFSWESAATHPKLAAGLYLYFADGSRQQELRKLNLTTGRFDSLAWPQKLEPLRRQLDWQSDELSSMSERAAFRFPWTFYPDIPALCRPIFQFSQDYSARASEAQHVGFLVVELSLPFLQKEYLPELVERYFGKGQVEGFEVLVQTVGAPYEIIYPAGFKIQGNAGLPDAAANLLDPTNNPPGRRGGPMVRPSNEDRQWAVVARHISGSLEAAVMALRWRNLAVSFGLLFALAACTALIIELARRTHRLAELQMEFVAGVSHELCTPLAVICSAADNLADGVMDDPQQTREYGDIIRGEGRRLSRMVDEVLLFASGQGGRFQYDLRPVEVGAIIDRALASVAPAISEAGFAVEKDVAEGTPLVTGDAGALAQCLENLLGNAVKYGRANPWVAVRARAVPGSRSGEVEISVEDKGSGIPPEELPHVFDPFFRSRAARDAQIRGVGLGLHLVKRMTEAMGGRVSVSSRLGAGSVFTLHLPAAPVESPVGETA